MKNSMKDKPWTPLKAYGIFDDLNCCCGRYASRADAEQALKEKFTDFFGYPTARVAKVCLDHCDGDTLDCEDAEICDYCQAPDDE